MTVRDYTRRARSVSIEFSQLIRAAGALDRRTLGYWQVDLRLGGPPHEPAELYRPAEAGRSAWRSRRSHRERLPPPRAQRQSSAGNDEIQNVAGSPAKE